MGSSSWQFQFGQNQISNRWDIPDMDKCLPDKCCLDKCHRDSWNLFKIVPVGWWVFIVSFVSNLQLSRTEVKVWYAAGYLFRCPMTYHTVICRIKCDMLHRYRNISHFIRHITVWYVIGHLNRYPAAYHTLTSVRLNCSWVEVTL